jgi:gliding motility-associated-like protein
MERLKKIIPFSILSLLLAVSLQAQNKEKENPYFTTISSFTPNNDGVNDFWRLEWKSKPDSIKLTIYNRWGQIIAESKNQDFEWNGKNRKNKDAENGTYVFSVEIYTFGEIKKYNGSITLIR